MALGIDPNQAGAFAADFNALNPAISAENNLAVNSPARFIGYSTSNPTGLQPVNLSSYLTQGAASTPATLANVASSQNYSDIAALESLLGGGSNIALPISSMTADQAGKGLNVNASDTLDMPGFTSAISPLIPKATAFDQYVRSGAASDPAQNSAQAGVIGSGIAGIEQIIAYLNQLAGYQGQGITPPPGNGGIRPI